MSNQNKKVIVDIETRGGDKLKASFDNARASAEAMDAELIGNLKQTQKEAQGLIDKEIAYAREKGNSLKALELINDALGNEFNSEGRNLDLLIKQVQVQKELAALATSKQGPLGGSFASQISLALAENNYTRALEINSQAQREAANDQTALNILRVQAISITEAQTKAEQGMNNAMSNARGGRDALFAFGLALNLVINELGTNLPPAAKEAASGIKIVADSMLAGAYIAGPTGAVIGALSGIFLSVAAAGFALDPAIKALNDDLDKLGKHDDAATGLAHLAGVSQDAAQAALDFAKANAAEADMLRGLSHNAEDAQKMVAEYNKQIANGISPVQARNVVEYLYGRALTDSMLAAQGALKAETELDQQRQQGIMLGKSADTLGENFLSAQQSNWDAMQAASEKFYGETLPQIAADGLERRNQIQQQYNDRLKEIDESLNQARKDAYANYQQNVLDAEINASDRRIQLGNELRIALADAEEQSSTRRTQIVDNYNETLEKQAQTRAEKLLQIQIAYQNAIEQIQDTYEQSRFNAISNQDAKALVLANMARERALRKENEAHQQQLDAVERQRAIDAANAKEAQEKSQKQLDDSLAKQKEKLQDSYEKQMRALDESLRKQESKLKETYEARIKALEEAAQKQKDAAGDTREKEFNAQKAAEQKALNSAQRAYDDQARVREDAYTKKLIALGKSLADEDKMTQAGAYAILNSLKDILSPAAMDDALKGFNDAFNARISIKVTPLGNGSIVNNAQYAEGGYTGARGGVVHPNELVLPLSNESRTSQLMQQYVPQRVMQQMPTWASQSASSSNNSGELHVHVHMDNSMLNATIEQNTTEMLMQVIPQVHQGLNRGGM